MINEENRLALIPRGVDDIIAKFVHSTTAKFELEYNYDSDNVGIYEPYIDQDINNGSLIFKGYIKFCNGIHLVIDEDLSLDTLKTVDTNFLNETHSEIKLHHSVFLNKDNDMITMWIGEYSQMTFNIKDHPWIYDLVKFIYHIKTNIFKI